MFGAWDSIVISAIGSAIAVLISLGVRRFAKVKFVTITNFREIQEEQRKLHNEHFVLTEDFEKYTAEQDINNKQHIMFACKTEFEEFKKECRECQKELPEKYATCVEMHRLYDRLEDIHRQDMDVSYKTMKGGFESITTRVDNLIKKEHEKE